MSQIVLLLAVTALFVDVAFQEVSALKCWRCSTDSSSSAFCDDPFDSSSISEKQRRWSFVECSYPPGLYNPYSNAIEKGPLCKKVKQLINNKPVISRSCAWANKHDPKDVCINDTMPSYIQNEFCETCDTDGCNGAGQFAPIAALVAIPIILIAQLSH